MVPFHPMAYQYMVHNCNRPAGAEALCVELPRGHLGTHGGGRRGRDSDHDSDVPRRHAQRAEL